MITEEQYLEAKKIVEEYEHQEFVEASLQAEDDEDDYNEPEECDDCFRIPCVCSEAMDCHCGAWVMGANGMCHVADCIC